MYLCAADTRCPPVPCQHGSPFTVTPYTRPPSITNPQLPLSATSDFVALITQVVDEDVYQRQGENIITWVEAPPLIGAANGAGAGAGGTGVDLALSFQVHRKA